MDFHLEQNRHARFRERIARKCFLVFPNGGQVSEARLLDVSVPGTFSGTPRTSHSGRRSPGAPLSPRSSAVPRCLYGGRPRDPGTPVMQRANGFTLIELMIVVAILGILISVATVSYNHFVIKAQSVEGEIVAHEVERLETLYHASNQAYTNSFADLGFTMTGTLKYYTPEVRMGSAIDKISYQVRAVPVATSATDAWLLTSYRDGSVQVDRIPVSVLGVFATVRYMGNAVAMTSSEATTISLGSVESGNNEPEWTDTGSRLRGCQECGRVVINQRF